MSSADDVRMTEKPVPETLETIAAKIDALNKSVDRRFEESAETIAAKIDALSKSVDLRFEETRAQLGVKIEAVDTKVKQVYDEVIAMREESKRNATDVYEASEQPRRPNARAREARPREVLAPGTCLARGLTCAGARRILGSNSREEAVSSYRRITNGPVEFRCTSCRCSRTCTGQVVSPDARRYSTGPSFPTC